MKNESTLEISEKLVAIIYMETKYLELICSRIITSWVISSRRRWKRDERALRSEEARIGGGKRAIMAVIGEECLWESLLWKTRRVTRRHEDAKTPDEYLNALLPKKRRARDENAFDPRKRSFHASTSTRKIRNDFSSLTRISSRGALMPPRNSNVRE